MSEFLSQPWPWYVSGPLIGLMVPLLLWMGNKKFGVSSSFRTICSMCVPMKPEAGYLGYDWKSEVWNLFVMAGIMAGGYIGFNVIGSGADIPLTEVARTTLSGSGVTDFYNLLPADFFNWDTLLTWKGILRIFIGGILIGFGTRYADGCTSGHAIFGISTMQWGSMVALIGFFIGGLISTHLLFSLFF
jgi:hypothetical protein